MNWKNGEYEAVPKHPKICPFHSEPFACHSERSEESQPSAQGKLREDSNRVNKLENRDSSLPAGRHGLSPQNDILEQPQCP